MKKHTSLLFAVVSLLTLSRAMAQDFQVKINEALISYTTSLVGTFDHISQDRKDQLIEIGEFLVANQSETEPFSTLFVCTHNSRRSHIADTWFKFGLVYYGIQQLDSYSGGTEATAFNPKAIASLERAGFSIAYSKKVTNPAVSVAPGNYPVWKMKSKKFDHSVNPKSNFVAVMVCSEADKSCPIVPGAVGRFALPYNDPRYYDNTPSQDLKYDETVAEIGREMLFLTHYVKAQLIEKLERVSKN